MSDESWLDPKSSEEVQRILGELRNRLERIYGDRLRGMYLYGSYARGEPERGSDLDVLRSRSDRDMNAFVAITDRDWFDFLAAREDVPLNT